MWHLFWFCKHVAVQDVHRAAVGNLLVTSCPCPRFELWATGTALREQSNTATLAHIVSHRSWLKDIERYWKYIQIYKLKWTPHPSHKGASSYWLWHQASTYESFHFWKICPSASSDTQHSAVNVPWVGDRLPAVHRRPSSRRDWKNLAVSATKQREQPKKHQAFYDSSLWRSTRKMMENARPDGFRTELFKHFWDRLLSNLALIGRRVVNLSISRSQ